MSEKTGILSKIPKLRLIDKVRSSIALKTVITVTLCFIIIIFALVYISNKAQQDLLLQQEKTVMDTQYNILMGQLESTEKLTLALATLLSHMEEIQGMFYDRDREGLARLTVPAFEALKPIIGMEAQGQFLIPRATSFLRMYDVAKHSDDLSDFRSMAVKTNEERIPQSGIEVGRYSASVRGIVPIFFEEEHMGAVEFGAGLSSEYLKEVSKRYGIRSAIFFDTKSTGVAAYLEAQRKQFKEPFVPFASSWTMKKNEAGAPTSVRQAVAKSKKTQIYYDDPGKKAVIVAPLTDYAKDMLGTIEIYLDRTAVLAQIAKTRNTSWALGIGLMILSIVAIGILVNRMVGTPIRDITSVYERVGMGDFSARSDVISQDELGTMAASLNAMLDNTLHLIQSTDERDAMQSSIMKLLDEISLLAEGDLSQRAEVTEDFTGAIADAFNDMVEQLGRVVRDVKDATLHVGATSKEVSISTDSLAEASEMQAMQVADAIAAINEMAASIQQVAENAAQSAAVSDQSTKHAKEGAEAVRNTNVAMEAIREHVQETARAIKRLGESSQEIGNIVQLINDIADRTSILALNASIQAAMAGDAGRGFAVVAEEVQRLAERSTNATKQIETLIKNIQGEINEAGASMEESIQRVVEGSKLADGARIKLEEIEHVSTQLSDLIQSISMASKQQARASENIAKTMEEVGDISSQTSAASRQTAVSMRNMSETADRLRVSVATFKLGEGDEESDMHVDIKEEDLEDEIEEEEAI